MEGLHGRPQGPAAGQQLAHGLGKAAAQRPQPLDADRDLRAGIDEVVAVQPRAVWKGAPTHEPATGCRPLPQTIASSGSMSSREVYGGHGMVAPSNAANMDALSSENIFSAPTASPMSAALARMCCAARRSAGVADHVLSVRVALRGVRTVGRPQLRKLAARAGDADVVVAHAAPG